MLVSSFTVNMLFPYLRITLLIRSFRNYWDQRGPCTRPQWRTVGVCMKELKPAVTDNLWRTSWLSSKTHGTPSVASPWRGTELWKKSVSKFLHVSQQNSHIKYSMFLFALFSRQHKLEEALLFSGRFTDALQALNDWLYRAEPQLAEDAPVGGDKDMVNNLIDKHKVQPSHIVMNRVHSYAEKWLRLV